MFADLDRLARGSDHTGRAAEHVRVARDHLQSVEVTKGVFGRTEVATSAEAVVSRKIEWHVHALDDCHRNLTGIRERTTGVTTGLHEADQAVADAVRRACAVDRRV